MEDYTKRYRLMCPGPVNVSQRVLDTMIASEIGHRECEFSALLRDIQQTCLTLMGLADKNYSVVVLTGSGSAANEAVLTSAIQPQHHVLSLATGEFGRRLGDISKIYNPNTTLHAQEWGSPLDLDTVENILQNHPYDWVTMVHHETSTGELQPVKAVGNLCHKYGAKLFVDAVSAFMADPLDLDDAHVDFMSTSSGKALCMPPGLSLVVGKTDEFKKLSDYPVRNYYLSLARHFAFAHDKLQTPNTPAVHLFIALHEALKMIAEEGVQNRLSHQTKKAQLFRTRLKDIGLTLFHPDHVLSNAVSTINLPDGTSFDLLRAALRDRGFIVYGGKGPLADRIFQVSTMGAVSFDDIEALVRAIQDSIACANHSAA